MTFEHKPGLVFFLFCWILLMLHFFFFDIEIGDKVFMKINFCFIGVDVFHHFFLFSSFSYCFLMLTNALCFLSDIWNFKWMCDFNLCLKAKTKLRKFFVFSLFWKNIFFCLSTFINEKKIQVLLIWSLCCFFLASKKVVFFLSFSVSLLEYYYCLNKRDFIYSELIYLTKD